jgi:hypothetical protein
LFVPLSWRGDAGLDDKSIRDLISPIHDVTLSENSTLFPGLHHRLPQSHFGAR